MYKRLVGILVAVLAVFYTAPSKADLDFPPTVPLPHPCLSVELSMGEDWVEVQNAPAVNCMVLRVDYSPYLAGVWVFMEVPDGYSIEDATYNPRDEFEYREKFRCYWNPASTWGMTTWLYLILDAPLHPVERDEIIIFFHEDPHMDSNGSAAPSRFRLTARHKLPPCYYR